MKQVYGETENEEPATILLKCPYCPRRVTPKELRDYEGMCEYCWQTLEQMSRHWNLETLQGMFERAKTYQFSHRLEQTPLMM